MMRSLFLGLAAVVAATVVAGSVQAQPTTPGAPGEPHGRRDFLQRKLGLTDDQAKQVRQIHEMQADAHRKNMQALHAAQRELRLAVLNGADEATVRARQTDVTNLMAETVRLRVESLKQISPILTPEQRQKLADMAPGRGHGPRRGDMRPQGQSS